MNAYISQLVFAFVDKDFMLLAKNVATVLLLSNMINAILNFLMAKIMVGRKIKKIDDHFFDLKDPKKEAKKSDFAKQIDDLNESVHKQYVMAKPPPHLVFLYSEPIIQFGTIVLFASSFTLGPLFSLLNNTIKIYTTLNNMTHFSRRNIAKGSSGAGFWVFVMEIFAVICVPVNIAILYFTGFVNVIDKPNGKRDFMIRNLLKEELSKSNPDYWTPLNALLLLVAIEHVILALKIVIAAIIPDVPNQVIRAEEKRPQILEYATQDLKAHKKKTKAKTLKDLKQTQENEMANNMDNFEKMTAMKNQGLDMLA